MISRRKFLKWGALASLALFLPQPKAWGAEPARVWQEKWDSLSPAEKQELEKKWGQFKSLPPERQAALQAAFEKYQRLSTAEKEEVLRNYEVWKQLSKEEKAELKQKFARWQQYTEEERSQFREAFRKNSTGEGEKSKAADMGKGAGDAK